MGSKQALALGRIWRRSGHQQIGWTGSSGDQRLTNRMTRTA